MRRGTPRRWLLLALVVLLLPVPWRHVSDSAVGLAWGMDNRLVLGDDRDVHVRVELVEAGEQLEAGSACTPCGQAQEQGQRM